MDQVYMSDFGQSFLGSKGKLRMSIHCLTE